MNNNQGLDQDELTVKESVNKLDDVYWTKGNTKKEQRDMTPQTPRIYDADLSDRADQDATENYGNETKRSSISQRAIIINR